ncbi:MAG: peptidylprolyl isomerase [Flavihumibacter sp.]
MKTVPVLFCLLLLCGVQALRAQTLFSYGTHKVGKAEFEEAFHRNNQDAPLTAKACRDYLDLYIRYKLKVQAAYDSGLDTLLSQQKEAADFRAQIIGGYLSDDSMLTVLASEALIRSREDRRISHIYIPYSGTDTAAACSQARTAMDALKSGKTFEEVALLFSKDPSVAVNKGDIGWISAFLLPYRLESLAYETPLQQYSGIYRGSDACHIFFVSALRPAKGTIRLQQILLAVPYGSAPEVASRQKAKADSLYALLLKGADFGELAHRFSDDVSTYQTQGIMNAFQPGTYEPAFEEAAYALPRDSAVSEPFLTSRGFHIIKRLTVYPAVTGDSASIFAAMKTKVSADPRIRIAAEMNVSKAKRLTGFTSVPVPAAVLDRYISGFEAGSLSSEKVLPDNMVLGSTNGARFTAAAFGDWLRINLEALKHADPPYTNTALLQRFLDQSLMQEYQLHLEKYNTAFARQFKAFTDGNLVFEVMQREIWDKAGNDEAGLQQYYAAHRQQYRWAASFSGVLFTGADLASANQYITELRKNPAAWSLLAAAYSQTILPDSGRFETSQLNFTLPASLPAGGISEPVYNKESGNYQFLWLQKRHLSDEQRSFSDARGLVLNDYQQLLENRWISRLKKKYPVVVNKTVLQAILPK